MLRAIFTLDYEIHGSGMGSPTELMVDPTRRMLDQFDRHGAKLTILADVAEILKFKQHLERTGLDAFDYNDIVAQLRRAVASGHDVQLHLHSSYFNSSFNGRFWEMDYSEYDLANLPYDRVSEMIAQGKAFLQRIMEPVDPDYRCFAFRAANWSMQPAHNIARALVEHGFNVDTSVFKWGRYDDLVHFDYSDAHSALAPWPASLADVCQRDPSSPLFEFPIYCELQPLTTFLTPNRVYRVVAQRLNPLPKEAEVQPAAGGAGGGGLLALPGKLLRAGAAVLGRHPWKADFNQCSGQQLCDAMERAQAQVAGADQDLPFVLIGHSKTYTRLNERSLEPYLRFVRDDPRFGFGTFGDFDLERIRAAAL